MIQAMNLFMTPKNKIMKQMQSTISLKIQALSNSKHSHRILLEVVTNIEATQQARMDQSKERSDLCNIIEMLCKEKRELFLKFVT